MIDSYNTNKTNHNCTSIYIFSFMTFNLNFACFPPKNFWPPSKECIPVGTNKVLEVVANIYKHNDYQQKMLVTKAFPTGNSFSPHLKAS